MESMKKAISFFMTICLMVSLFSFGGVSYAQGDGEEGPSDIQASSGQSIAFVSPGSITSDALTVDPYIAVTSSGSFYQAVVKVRNATSGDALSISNSEIPHGLTAYGIGTSTLVLAGVASGSAFQSAMREVTYQNTKGDFSRLVDIDFYLTYGYSPGTLVGSESESYTWTDANIAASASGISYVTYLADIYSEAEYHHILYHTNVGNNAAWLGGSDSATEGAWYWTSGLAGTNAFYVTSPAVSVYAEGYNNWASGEPQTDGDYLAKQQNGSWISTTSGIGAYIKEFAWKTTKQIAFFDHFDVTCETPVLQGNDMTVTVQAIGKHGGNIDYAGYFVPGVSDESAFAFSGLDSFTKTPIQLNTSGQAVITYKTLKAGDYRFSVRGTEETYYRYDYFTPVVVYHIVMTASDSAITAGGVNKITLTRQDINGNAITNSGIDTVNLSVSAMTSPGAYANGSYGFYSDQSHTNSTSSAVIENSSSTTAVYFYSEKAAYPATLTGSISDSDRYTTSTSFTVNHEIVTKFAVSTSAFNVYGDEQDVEVTALDRYNNTVKNYDGTVFFTIEDTGDTEFNPTNYKFTTGSNADNGYHFFDNAIRFGQVGTKRWVDVTDTDTNKLITGRQQDITVTPKALTVTGTTVASKVEDGNTVATISGPILNGVISPDNDHVSLTWSAIGTFSSELAGTHGVDVSMNLISSPSATYPLGNYTLTLPHVTGTITPRIINTGGNSGGSTGGSSSGGSGTVTTPVTTTTSAATTSSATGTTGQVTLRFNIGNVNSYLTTGTSGEQLKLMDIAPVIYEERTLLPIRFVVEPLGGVVTYSYEEQKVTVVKGTTTIELWIGNNMAKVNGVLTMIDPNNLNVKPIVIDPPGRTMMPLRFISEALGCTVEYSYELQQIIVKN